MAHEKPLIVLAAGGTGGHIFPAEALARELLAQGCRVAMITDRRGGKFGDDLQVPVHRVQASILAGSLSGKLKSLALMGAGYLQARMLLARLKPAAVVGFGGYPSVPTVYAASGAGIPIILHEQNAVLGRANRALMSQAKIIATSFPQVAGLGGTKLPRLVQTGNPVRPAFAVLRERPYATVTQDGPLNLFVMGGSQGARIFSEVVPRALGLLPEPLRRRITVAQQCRPEDIELARTGFAAAGIDAELASFFRDVPERMAHCHLAVCRAGASTVAELTALGRPAILVPYPFGHAQEQAANAEALAEAGGAWLIPQNALSAEALAVRLEALLTLPVTLDKTAAAAKAWGTVNAAENLAACVYDLIGVQPQAKAHISGDHMTPSSPPAPATPASGNFFSPAKTGKLHFVGIGGIGMSGIAEILHNQGFQVQGSDVAENSNVKRLRDKYGMDIAIGHKADNLGGAAIVVISSAVKPDNPEVVAARAASLPVVRRAEMLGELMRLQPSIAIGGTHGKTTTTSMVAEMFDSAGLDPTVINGGIINTYGTNARLGSGKWLVAESDESDGSFTHLPATIAVVTNIDPEHMDHYRSFDALRGAFDNFVQNVPFYGFAVLCVDHPEVRAMMQRVTDRRLVTYGFSADADIRADNVKLGPDGSRFDAVITDRKTRETRTIEGLHLTAIGQHNVQNSLAAIAIATQLGPDFGFTEPNIRAGLDQFRGVKRRFERTGEANGVTIIDDYGHHPVEIAATLKAARHAAGAGRVIAVVQPHRYTRLDNLFNEFRTCCDDADSVIVADVYAAGETPIPGIDRDKLVAGMRESGHKDVRPLPSPADLPALVAEIAQPGDFVICLGAGSISGWANALPQQLQALGPPAEPQDRRMPQYVSNGPR